ncbi:MAG: nicotinate phosphoribosyltransferase [bacterium]|nr:nicotinate phosphoribosyltransferase [bacterium]
MAPIIQSSLDTDYYKVTMGQAVFRHYRGVDVTYEFINRTKRVSLARFIREEDVRRELDHVRTLSFSRDELAYLKGFGIFGDDYLSFLAELRLPPYDLQWGSEVFSLRFRGPWESAIYWEIPALAIVNELYFRSLLEDCDGMERRAVYDLGRANLARKIALLREHPYIFFSDFGTRRRAGYAWQAEVARTVARELPEQFIGTSDVAIAMRYGLKPSGTSAHEMPMIVAGLYHGVSNYLALAQNEVSRVWWDMYGYDLSVALNDTWGSEFFFRTAPPEIARDWKSIRIDSGDPLEEGEKCIRWYEAYGIDPRTKTLIFSDGLDLPAILRIAAHFRGRIGVVFGWGTNLTNDFGPKFPPVSIVVKATRANGRGLVKLSNNIAKATGDPADIEKIMKEVGYTTRFQEECKY